MFKLLFCRRIELVTISRVDGGQLLLRLSRQAFDGRIDDRCGHLSVMLQKTETNKVLRERERNRCTLAVREAQRPGMHTVYEYFPVHFPERNRTCFHALDWVLAHW